MEFKRSKYYNRGLLGENLCKNIRNIDEILTAQQFFNINDNQNEYENYKESEYLYKLKVFDNHYELDCQLYDPYLYLIFNKPVHITGKHCSKIIAPEIIVKNSESNTLSYCVANKVLIHNSYKNYCEISYSKIKNINFHNERVRFYYSEIDNFFIFNKDLQFDYSSSFLDYHKIKFFGTCKGFKEKILEYRNFKKGIIHIE